MKKMSKFISAFLIAGNIFCIPAVSAETLSTTTEETVENLPDTTVINSEVIEEKTISIDATDIFPEDSKEITDSPISGNGRLIEDVLDGNVNRQFLTIQSKNGNTFYIIVDKDDKGGENVYFMNLVDEYDLMAFAEDFPEETKAKKPATTEPIVTDKGGKPVSTIPETDENGEPVSIPVSNPGGSNNTLLLLIGILVLGGGAAFYFFKVKGNPNTQKKPDIDIDDDEYDDEPETDENSDE